LQGSFCALSKRPSVPFRLREWERKRASQVHLGLLRQPSSPSAPYISVFCASLYCRFGHCGSTLLSFSAQRLCVMCFNLLTVQCSVVHRPARSLQFIDRHVLRTLRFLAGSPSAPCDLLLTLDLLQRPAFALPDHCVSSPCGSITAVQRWISLGALCLL
jgi:hypothetical protein